MVINEKVAYLKGIIDTANIKNDTPEGLFNDRNRKRAGSDRL